MISKLVQKFQFLYMYPHVLQFNVKIRQDMKDT